ncbi:MAG: HEAT repeat domain-containing protein [Candidatus Latescibacteria bacterium]|nr:HEAT repeat domain-containing protein [Candidatus Latescibacterota bacterium]MDP7447909.1 HEAT repeat domain-containing protein [Candidatus Latescibacterota bacterium]HJP31455.1 HEAT repeat domain-containing protein [Candidatus Latescibacterota bacterium]
MTRVADITIFGRLAALATCLLACGSIDEHLADLDSPDPGVRQSAAYRLLLKGKAAAPALIAVVDSGSGNRRFIATQLLGKIGDPRAVVPLITQLQEASASPLRQAAAEALGKLGDDRAIGPLIEAVKTETEVTVRLSAVQGLATLRHADVSVYEHALEDWHPDVRKQGLLALVKFAPGGLEPHLRHLTGDPDPGLRYLVVQLLSRIGASAVPALIEALNDSTGAVREEAALALGRLGATEAKEALIDLMARSRDPDGEAARQALRQITGIDFVPTE